MRSHVSIRPAATLAALMALTAACDGGAAATTGGDGSGGAEDVTSTAGVTTSGSGATGATGSSNGNGGEDGANGTAAGGGGEAAGGNEAGGGGGGGEPSGGGGAGGEAPVIPPDIVLLLIDDLDLMAFDTMVASADPELYPSFKAAVGDGMRFTNYFATNAMCCPSRATYLTGQYPQNHGALDVTTGHGYWENTEHDDHTIATWLAAAGYQTGFTGKYMNGYGDGTEGEGLPTYVPPGWARWFALYGGTTYDMYENTISDDGVPITTTADDYQTDLLSETAVQFLDAAPLESPAFLYLAPTAPHHEGLPAYGIQDIIRGYPAAYTFTIRPAPRHEALVVPALPQRASFDEADVSDKPAWLQALAPIQPPDEAAIRDYWTDKLRALQAVDDMIAATRQALAARGRPSYLVITSDNGYFHGEHRLSEKGCAYEEAIRLPLVVVGPGIEPGSTNDALVVNNDVAPTLAELAGATPDIVVDGRTFAPLLLGDGAWSRRRFFVSHFAEDGTGVTAVDAVPPFRGLRTLVAGQNETFVQWFEDGLDAPMTAYERYDVAVDPLELESSHASVDPARKAALSQTLLDFSTCAGDSCRALEDAVE